MLQKFVGFFQCIDDVKVIQSGYLLLHATVAGIA